MPHRKRCRDGIAGEMSTTEACVPAVFSDRVPLLLSGAVCSLSYFLLWSWLFYKVLEEGAGVRNNNCYCLFRSIACFLLDV